VRSLARDLGAAITGFPGCLSALRRTAIGAYRVEDAWTLDELPERLTGADLIAAPSLEGPRPRADEGYRGPSKPGAA
jgi:tRNA pseudouridine55 synthase